MTQFSSLQQKVSRRKINKTTRPKRNFLVSKDRYVDTRQNFEIEISTFQMNIAFRQNVKDTSRIDYVVG